MDRVGLEHLMVDIKNKVVRMYTLEEIKIILDLYAINRQAFTKLVKEL